MSRYIVKIISIKKIHNVSKSDIMSYFWSGQMEKIDKYLLVTEPGCYIRPSGYSINKLCKVHRSS